MDANTKRELGRKRQERTRLFRNIYISDNLKVRITIMHIATVAGWRQLYLCFLFCVVSVQSVLWQPQHGIEVLTDLHIYNLDAVPPIHLVSNHVDTDKLTTANGGSFTSSSASCSSQSR